MGLTVSGLMSSSSVPKPEPVSEVDKAQAQLMVTRDDLRRYSKRLSTAIPHCKETIKTCLHSKRKHSAVLTLRKLKFLERSLETTESHLSQIEELMLRIDQSEVQSQVFDALRSGTDFLKAANAQLTIDDVEKLVEETQDAHEYQQRISDTLTKAGVAADEKELLSQLDALEALEGTTDVDMVEVPRERVAEGGMKADSKEVLLG